MVIRYEDERWEGVQRHIVLVAYLFTGQWTYSKWLHSEQCQHLENHQHQPDPNYVE